MIYNAEKRQEHQDAIALTNKYKECNTNTKVKLLEVTDENNTVLKVTPKEREMIENFFSTKLIFDIKKNF